MQLNERLNSYKFISIFYDAHLSNDFDLIY